MDVGAADGENDVGATDGEIVGAIVTACFSILNLVGKELSYAEHSRNVGFELILELISHPVVPKYWYSAMDVNPSYWIELVITNL